MLYVKFITGCLATALLLGSCTKVMFGLISFIKM